MSGHARATTWCGWLVFLAACSSDQMLGDATLAAGDFPPVSSFDGAGPFATVVDRPAGVACTIHRPAALGQGGVTHPVILWGNGTFTSPATYAQLLSHWASHGFIAAAANTSNAGNGTQMIACLDFLASANGDPSSAFFQKVDTGRVGASGHSQGGAGTIMAGRDARVDVTAPVEPFIGLIPGGGRFDRNSIGRQTGDMFLVSGGADGVARPATHQQPVFDGANESVVWGTLAGATHFEALGDAGDFRGPLTAWFRFQLMDDASAGDVFTGDCDLCNTAGWTVQFND